MNSSVKHARNVPSTLRIITASAEGRQPRAASRSRRLRQHGLIKNPDQIKAEQERLYRENLEMKKERSETQELRSDDATDDQVQHATDTNELHGFATSDPPGPVIPDYVINEEDVEETSIPFRDGKTRTERDDNAHRKSKILMEIMQSGPGVHECIQKYSSEIDQLMLEMLESRIKTARQLEQDDEVIKGLVYLYRYLKAEYDRNTASPSLRLLDTLLQLFLDSDTFNPEQSQDWEDGPPRSRHEIREEAKSSIAARLQMAFDGSASLETDVISLARDLSSGAHKLVDEMLQDSVTPQEFIPEVEALLQNALEQQEVLQNLIAQNDNAETKHELQMNLAQRATAIANVEEILAIARLISSKMGY